MSDRVIIFATAGLRAIAVSLSGVVFALALATVGLNVWQIGVAISLGLAGCALATLLAAAYADRWGRKHSLIALGMLMALGGLCVAVWTRPGWLLAAAFFGMVNGMGRDRGAGVTIDQAILPQTVSASERTRVFAWYNLTVDAGHAAGALLGGLPAVLRGVTSLDALGSYQWTFACYSVLALASALVCVCLSPGVEPARKIPRRSFSSRSKPIVVKFSALSGLDSFGGGFLTTSLIGYWFFRRFGVDEAVLGPLFFFVRIANGLSHLAAAWLAKRIGLVNTMVFTHIPSSLLLIALPFVPSLPLAIGLYLMREGLVEMDVPTRQSYIVAVVEEEERMHAAGIANFVRATAWAVSPSIAGSLMRSRGLSAPLFVGGGIKIVYDLLLYQAFRHIKPPEERRSARSSDCLTLC